MGSNESCSLYLGRFRSCHDKCHQEHSIRNHLCRDGNDEESRLLSTLILRRSVCKRQYEGTGEDHSSREENVKALLFS